MSVNSRVTLPAGRSLTTRSCADARSLSSGQTAGGRADACRRGAASGEPPEKANGGWTQVEEVSSARTGAITGAHSPPRQRSACKWRFRTLVPKPRAHVRFMPGASRCLRSNGPLSRLLFGRVHWQASAQDRPRPLGAGVDWPTTGAHTCFSNACVRAMSSELGRGAARAE